MTVVDNRAVANVNGQASIVVDKIEFPVVCGSKFAWDMKTRTGTIHMSKLLGSGKKSDYDFIETYLSGFFVKSHITGNKHKFVFDRAFRRDVKPLVYVVAPHCYRFKDASGVVINITKDSK